MRIVTKNQFVSGSIWKIAEAVATKGVSLLVTIILTRLLSPSEYGVIELTTIFIALSNIFFTGGFNTALIRQDEVDELDYSSVLWISTIIATVCYCIIYVTAPYIAIFYDESRLTDVLRTVTVVFFSNLL